MSTSTHTNHHKCARCGVADEFVHGYIPKTMTTEVFEHDSHRDCLKAFQRKVAAKDAGIAALRADKAALEIRERELERDLEGAMSQCAILSADVERVTVMFWEWCVIEAVRSPGRFANPVEAFAAFRASEAYPK